MGVRVLWRGSNPERGIPKCPSAVGWLGKVGVAKGIKDMSYGRCQGQAPSSCCPDGPCIWRHGYHLALTGPSAGSSFGHWGSVMNMTGVVVLVKTYIRTSFNYQTHKHTNKQAQPNR